MYENKTRYIFFLIIWKINGICFTAIGDWGERNPNQEKVAFAMSEVVKENNCSFVISTGDNFYPNGVKSIYDKKWNYVFEDVYHYESLQNKRWYITAGNHDYDQGWKGVQAQIDYTKISNRWYFPNRYYTEIIEIEAKEDDNINVIAIQFIFIDTHRWNEEQEDWFISILENSKTLYKIVVGHNPVYSEGRYKNEMAQTILPELFEKYKVIAYICGHEHHLQYIKKNEMETHYFISGGGSYLRLKEKMKGIPTWYAKELGFLMCQIKNEKDEKNNKCEFFNLEQKVLHSVLLNYNNNNNNIQNNDNIIKEDKEL